jgi:hypothetical protein
MLNDIYATSMSGTYQTREGEEQIERGTWSYRGHGSAEITVHALAERGLEGVDFEVTVHSAERQVGLVSLEMWESGIDDERITVRAHIAGSQMDIQIVDAEGSKHEGTLSVPDETVFLGPSPVWLVHMMMTSPVPEDRAITTPYVAFGLHGDDVEGGFYRLTRHGNIVSIAVLDADGAEIIPADIGNGVPGLEIILADDGCPEIIRSGRVVTDLVRVPENMRDEG